MRVKWEELLPSGTEERNTEKKEFIRGILEFTPGNRLPPYPIILKLLDDGVVGGGMEGGIKWSPGDVTVDREEYKEIYKDLGGDEESFDDDFEDFDHWVAYCFSKDYGVDYVKQVEFRKRIKDIEVKLREENSEELEEQYIDLLNEYCDFMDESTLKGSG